MLSLMQDYFSVGYPYWVCRASYPNSPEPSLVLSPFRIRTTKAKNMHLSATWNCKPKSANSQNHWFTSEGKQAGIMNKKIKMVFNYCRFLCLHGSVKGLNAWEDFFPTKTGSLSMKSEWGQQHPARRWQAELCEWMKAARCSILPLRLGSSKKENQKKKHLQNTQCRKRLFWDFKSQI